MILLGCRAAPPAPTSILGTWEIVIGEAIGLTIVEKGDGSMRITIAKGKARWDFLTEQGWQSFDGLCRIDPDGHSGWIDLGEPKSKDPSRVSLGIYKIERGMLQINMGPERPKDFEQPALAKLTFKPFKR